VEKSLWLRGFVRTEFPAQGIQLITSRPRLTISAILIIATLLLGLAIDAGFASNIDTQVSRLLALRAGDSSDALIAATQGVSWFGGGIPRWLVVVLLCMLLWRSAGRRLALLLAATAGAANLASSLLKNLFDRPRPGLIPHLDHVSSWSYPSGHATSVTAIALAFVLLAPAPWRRTAAGFAVVAILLTGLSRVMLGVHWPSDVLGGTMLGAAAALAIAGSGLRVSR
jgi:undecaprenyl-diphosphatase